MTPHYADDWLTVYHGDTRAVMAEMEPESVHCVVTSPPYWGLRDYGTAIWVGGDESCDHPAPPRQPRNGRPLGAFHGGSDDGNASREPDTRRTCHICRAIRQDGQLGLEPTPEAYVASMVDVFREVRRVLRSDGTVWLNLGDSYAAGPMTAREMAGERSGGTLNGRYGHVDNNVAAQRRSPVPTGLKPKDLVGIPWMVAFALRADGWYLRSDIIWAKPNPMPESVTDRPTKSHEYLFLLTKSPRYYFDADAVREPHLPVSLARIEKPLHHKHPDNVGVGIPPVDTERFANPAGRNIRSVWTVATAPYPGAHFATFPPKLIEPCIKAGTSEKGVCPECGAPWERVVDASKYEPPVVDVGVRNVDASRGDKVRKLSGAEYNAQVTRTTTGWVPTCMCHTIIVPEPVPAVVLDPFAGSGTTGLVAQKHSRRAVLIDLSMDYLGQLLERNRDIPLGLGT